jgi:tetratricopeptide (TPR) repeat protein
LKWLKKSLDISKKYNYQRLYCEALNSLGINYYAKNDITKALEILNEGLQFADSIKYAYGQGINYLSLSDISLRKGENSEVREVLRQSITYF